MSATSDITFAILTVSDSCSSGKTVDTSGDNLENLIKSGNLFKGVVSVRKCIPDDQQTIQDVLRDWCTNDTANVILTTGGTGFSPRDVTPEATKNVIEKEAPGLTFAMMQKSLAVTPMAMLSRLACGIRNKSIIINLPGSKKASAECLMFVAPGLHHAVDLLLDRKGSVIEMHQQVQGGSSPGVGHRHHHHHHVCEHRFDHDQSSAGHSTIVPVARRQRVSPWPSISVKEAQDIVLREALLLDTETVPFLDGLGRILAEDVFAKDPLPPFRASIKDGYAVIASDGVGLREVIGSASAGANMEQFPLSPGQCIRINTGAPVPSSADAIVQVEDTKLVKCTEDGQTELQIEILVAPSPEKDIRQIGSDISVGEKMLSVGICLGPSELGILATVGAVHVKVYKRPVIGVLSTGNELVEPGDGKLETGKIRDSNKTTISSLLRHKGFPTVDLGIALDTLENMTENISSALSMVDVLISTGSVSMGDKDFLKPVLQNKFSASIHFGRIFMKPGLPTTFATVEHQGKKKLIFGLPGNPVSATVTCHLYVLPVVRKMSGYLNVHFTTIKVQVDENYKLDPRPEFVRANVCWDNDKQIFKGQITGAQISSRLPSMSLANGLLIFPGKSDAKSEIKPSEFVDCLLVGNL